MQQWRLSGLRRLPGTRGWNWTIESQGLVAKPDWMLSFGSDTARATLWADHALIGVLAGGLDSFAAELLTEAAAAWLVQRGLRRWQRKCLRTHGVIPALQNITRLRQVTLPEQPEAPHQVSLTATKDGARVRATLHCNAAGLDVLLRLSAPLPGATTGWGALPIVMQVEKGAGTLTLEEVASLREGDLVTLDRICTGHDLRLLVQGRDFGRAEMGEQGLIVNEVYEPSEGASAQHDGFREIQGPSGLKNLEIAVSVERARLAVPLSVLLALEPGSKIPLQAQDSEGEYVLRVQDVAVAAGRVEVHPHSGLDEPSFTVTRVYGAVAPIPSVQSETADAAGN